MDNPTPKNIQSQKFTEIRPTEFGSSLSVTHSHLPSSSDTSVIKWGPQPQHGHHPQQQLIDKEPPQPPKQPSTSSRHVTTEESTTLLPAAGVVGAAGSISAAGSDIEIDDVKSTGSSHPFSSPNPSEFDDHAASFTSSNPDHLSITGVGETKRHYKRRKYCDATSTSSSAAARLAYPLSERQQMARLMKLTAPESHSDKPKSPASCGGPPMHHISGAHSSYFGSIGQTTPGCHGSAGFMPCGSIGASASAAGSSFFPSSPSTQQTVTPAHKVRGKMAKIFRRNDRGETFLHLAAKRGDKKQCEELIKEGADVNAVDYAGWTALHEACNKGCLEAAEILMKNGANVNACGPEDDTPLHDAALNGNKDLVILLLKNGADACKSNAGGRTAKDVTDDQDIQLLLEKFSLGAIDFSSPDRRTSSSYVDLEEEQEATGITAGLRAVAGKVFEFDGDKSEKESLKEAQTKMMGKEKKENYKTASLDTLNKTKLDSAGVAPVTGNLQLINIRNQNIMTRNAAEYDGEVRLVVVEEDESEVFPSPSSGGGVSDYWNTSNKTVYNANESTKIEEDSPFQKVEAESEKKNFPTTTISQNAARKISLMNHGTTSTSPKSQSRLNRARLLQPHHQKHRHKHRHHKTKNGKCTPMIKALFAQTLAKSESLAANKRKTPGAGINEIAKKPGSSNDVYEFHSSDSESCTAESLEHGTGMAYSVPSPVNRNKSLKIVTDDFSEIRLNEAHDPSENQEKASSSSKQASPNSTSRKVSSQDQNLKDSLPLPPEASCLTTTPCSRKERLLGMRKVKKTIDFELEASESNPEMARKDSNEKETLEKTASFSRLTSQLSSPPRRSSMIELSNVNRNCSIGGVLTPSTSPKVPPLKLFLSNSCRASLTTPNNTSGMTPPLNASFAAEDEDSSSNFLRVNQDSAEGSQRVTRSQVRLHGSEEPSPLTFSQQPPPTPTLARKRKVKQSATNNKIIEPVNQVARYFKPTLANNIAVIASKNVYEAQYELRKMIEKKWREDKQLDSGIEYTKPKGYDKFIISRKDRILRSLKGMALESPTFPSSLRDVVEKQKEARHEMKNRHTMERDRLIIACETEALRVNNRIQRGTIDPPISAMRIIRDSEIYNSVQLEKPVSVEKYSEISSFNDLLARFTRSKNQMIGRQRLESGCLLATQTAEFSHELKIKENKTLVEYFQLDEKFPSVEVVVDFDLLPPELVQ